MCEDNILEEKPEEELIFQCSLKYSLVNSKDEIMEESIGTIQLKSKSITILGGSEFPIELIYEDISKILPGNYNITLLLSSKDRLILSELGYRFEDFLKKLAVQRNEVLITDLLMDEKRSYQAEGKYSFFGETPSENIDGDCMIYLYGTSIVVAPYLSNPRRIPFSLISEVSEIDYKIHLQMCTEDVHVISYLGENREIFKKTLIVLMGSLASKLQPLIKEILPGVNALTLRKASQLLKDGKAVSLKELQLLSPHMAKGLKNKLSECGAAKEFEFLESLSSQDTIHMGLKKGLLGDLTQDYIWFLIPIYSTEENHHSNIISMEALSSESSGKATYFFRIMPWNSYISSGPEALHAGLMKIINSLNYSMLSTNFRREPIYISQAKLEEPRNFKYKIAVQMLPELQLLRDLYIGRVIHTSYDKWVNDVNNLIESTLKSKDDNFKWKKS